MFIATSPRCPFPLRFQNVFNFRFHYVFNLRFQNVFRLHYNAKPAFSNSSGLTEKRFGNLPNGLVWIIGPGVEI